MSASGGTTNFDVNEVRKLPPRRGESKTVTPVMFVVGEGGLSLLKIVEKCLIN